jgi:hypothetical protein
VKAFIVEARSRESAESLYSLLAAFNPELIGDDGNGYRVSVSLGGRDQQVVEILNLLERHVNERRDGPARLQVGERRYTMHPDHPVDEPI